MSDEMYNEMVERCGGFVLTLEADGPRDPDTAGTAVGVIVYEHYGRVLAVECSSSTVTVRSFDASGRPVRPEALALDDVILLSVGEAARG